MWYQDHSPKTNFIIFQGIQLLQGSRASSLGF
jgi:hypothetical protein